MDILDIHAILKDRLEENLTAVEAQCRMVKAILQSDRCALSDAEIEEWASLLDHQVQSMKWLTLNMMSHAGTIRR